MGKKSKVAPEDRADELIARSREVVRELEAAGLLLSTRVGEWASVLCELHARAHGHHMDPEHPVADLRLVEMYREIFDKMEAASMLVDPYVMHLRFRTDG